MKLYDGQTGRFMMRGHPGARHAGENAIAGKLHELIFSIELAAMAFANDEVLEAVAEPATRRRFGRVFMRPVAGTKKGQSRGQGV